MDLDVSGKTTIKEDISGSDAKNFNNIYINSDSDFDNNVPLVAN